MDMLQRSISKLTRLCVNQDAKIATIRATIVAAILAGLLLVLMNLSSATGTPDFTTFEAGEERKKAFFTFFLPLIEEQNAELLEVRSDVLEMAEQSERLSFFEEIEIRNLAEDYGVEDFSPENQVDWETLLRRIDVVPASLALAQAANESAWGTSRFARQANNYFGHWCFVEGCGLVPERRPEGATHEVADFNTAAQAVARYMQNLNKHPAYKDLRAKRETLRERSQEISGLALVTELENYSERGSDYVVELAEMIRFNELEELDSASAGD